MSITKDQCKDIVGAEMQDTATIDFTYNPVTKVITADAIAGGIVGLMTKHGKTVYVDSVYGNDATGALEDENKPFLTIAAANAVATSGYLVWVRPGTYLNDNFILKDLVNYYFQEGVNLNYSIGAGNANAGIKDNGLPVTCMITGKATVNLTLSTKVFLAITSVTSRVWASFGTMNLFTNTGADVAIALGGIECTLVADRFTGSGGSGVINYGAYAPTGTRSITVVCPNNDNTGFILRNVSSVLWTGTLNLTYIGDIYSFSVVSVGATQINNIKIYGNVLFGFVINSTTGTGSVSIYGNLVTSATNQVLGLTSRLDIHGNVICTAGGNIQSSAGICEIRGDVIATSSTGITFGSTGVGTVICRGNISSTGASAIGAGTTGASTLITYGDVTNTGAFDLISGTTGLLNIIAKDGTWTSPQRILNTANLGVTATARFTKTRMVTTTALSCINLTTNNLTLDGCTLISGVANAIVAAAPQTVRLYGTTVCDDTAPTPNVTFTVNPAGYIADVLVV